MLVGNDWTEAGQQLLKYSAGIGQFTERRAVSTASRNRPPPKGLS